MKSTKQTELSPNHRVLLVDDDPSLLRLLSLRLTAIGLTVETASSGEQALSLVAQFKPHLVITDLRMGEMDGLALFEQLQQHYPLLPVIILTAHGTIQEAVKATRQGLFGFLTKPFDSKELIAQVEQALQISGWPQAESEQDTELDWRAEIITRSQSMEQLLQEVKRVAQGDASLFVHGESGTGKELIARAVHRVGPRRDEPFVAVNCSAIPAELLESELFGHVRGAFSGAVASREGLFQSANGGTLFLDEIGDMPPLFQVKLLRALQEQRVRPVGANQDVAVDVRIISASHHDLEALVSEGSFRQDLYYRLNVVTLTLPPLSERREDIPLLANHFLTRLAPRYGNRVKGFSAESLEALVQYDWPGNVRQLQNVIEQLTALSSTPIIPVKQVEKALKEKSAMVPGFQEAREHFEREYLMELLRRVSGNVSQAAKLAKRNRTEFYKLLKRHHLEPARFKQDSASD
ncbi:MAG: sigma 54-interacting transcriptional regulator [Sedimenticola sp.]|uniref:Response regulator n=1 Tax=Sedimenticola thiotaurini TaxID=1543721 RepID=A0A558D0F3_9GAMM|nr:sigma 54-interacting transcriptional regulator [Sedimenticola sp.]TVT54497.1 MAG: response regulator [Sedimenticola thiotaurini]MCW8883003.1 sigma 54-interacting transcriptional regulator [Sedimenticola sp.]MCW8947056.1 sigma 54-interacting transcriptional regulator [Sedimenticola sp.]MCW8976259.1 sigma 54-interacting transcriptional regulator [Sedimenticola sp.]